MSKPKKDIVETIEHLHEAVRHLHLAGIEIHTEVSIEMRYEDFDRLVSWISMDAKAKRELNPNPLPPVIVGQLSYAPYYTAFGCVTLKTNRGKYNG